MEEKNSLTAERSLEIIAEQMELIRRTMNENSSISLISWGTCVVVFALIIAYLWEHHGGPAWNGLWAVMWLCGCLAERLIGKHRQHVPNTFVGKTISQVWVTFGIFMGAIGCIFGLAGCGLLPVTFTVTGDHASAHLYINLTSIISLCFGIASTQTGFILKNRVVQACGIIAGLGGFFGALRYPWAEQLYVMAAVAVVGLIVPGIIIYLQHNK